MSDARLRADSSLSDAKRALLAQWLGASGNSSMQAQSSIPKRIDSRSAPLSYGQQQLWFFNQLQPQSPLYNIPIPMRLTGFLDLAALQTALDIIVERHEILRTCFFGEPQPHQQVSPPDRAIIDLIDLRAAFASEPGLECEQLLREEIRRPFDLSRDLMLRTRLIRIDESDSILVVTMHHMASDVWSWRVFCRELEELYTAARQQRPPSLAKLPLQYGDFAAWQEQSLTNGVYQAQLAYWRQKLTQAPTLLELPIDHSRPAVQTFQGACEFLTLPEQLTPGLDELARREGITLFMTLLAAFQALLHRYAGQEDVLVGSPTAGRNRVELERLIGNFVNTLVLRTSLAGDPTIRELLHRVREVVLEALTHQEVPFGKLVEELQPERSTRYLPLVQVLFALQDELALNLRLPEVQITPLPVDTGTAKFDLTLTVIESGNALKLCAEYNSDLFERPTIQRMLVHYRQLLEGFILHPQKHLSELALLTTPEREQILLTWNSTAMEYPHKKCVHQLFEEQAEQTPELTAVVFENRALTYRELNRRSNQLAHYLRRMGAGPETLVAVCLDRSADMVVAVLAILKAGAAYVPLDPSRALERIRFVLDDAKIRIVVTHQKWLSALPTNRDVTDPGERFRSAIPPETVGQLIAKNSEAAADRNVRAPVVEAICLDSDWPTISAELQDNPGSGVSAENLAYVIYTSGSTGHPKGVEIAHRAVVNFLHSMRREPGITLKDVLLAITSLSFDIAGLEIYLPLTAGARVVIAPAETVQDGVRLRSLLNSSQATVMQATPSTWRLLIDAGWEGSKTLKILCGGENLSSELAQDLIERGHEVWNLYGPTETTIWSTASKVRRDEVSITIGRPIANTQAYVLDRRLQPVPIGVAGELYLGGAGLARGYLNRPDLTGERFVRNPFCADSSTRLYRTGDRAKYLVDGRLEFLGRVDDQVKIRGHRVELGEIENVLARHAAVRRAVVTLDQGKPGEARLAAYFVPSPDSSITERELRAFLSQYLPDYSIPAAFVKINGVPVTPSGKVDRKALPSPPRARPDDGAELVPPRTGTEETVAKIWREVLDLPELGVYDNFFELGGHSLRLTQVISRVRAAFGVEVGFAEVFQEPTIASLAAKIEQVRGKDPITRPLERRIIRRRTTTSSAIKV